ncbi:MAG: spermidine/putrescine ABC transporter substrate-binding protein [Eubacteriales bacterium]|nr:spermidine/putrescine ABC transporter substrate-binding protein [Eubacteriales bacterium]
MKKRVIAVLMAAMAALPLSACGGGASTASAAGNAGELNLFIWTEYVPDAVIEQFEEETGIQVNVSTFSSNEDMLAKVRSEEEGAYDIVQPSDYMVQQMIANDMLEELDQEQLTNLGNIGEAYLDPSYDPGNVYSVPYLGGVVAIGVNTDRITDEITGYDDLFNPAYADTTVVLDDTRAIIGVTERSMGLSMNESDPDTLAEVQTKLLSWKPNIKLYDSDSPKSALISGDCTIGVAWSAEIALAMDENPAIEIVYPEEGAYKFIDNWTVPKGAKNYDNAMKFINYMLEAETGQAVAQEFPYLNPNAAAIELMDEEYRNNIAKNVPQEVIENAEFVENLDTDTLAILDQMWTELKK